MVAQLTERESASELQEGLVDSFGRTAKKLRISITDRCNMQCIYCMPTGNNRWLDAGEILSDSEIVGLARIFVGLGIEKIRITGGEPMLRPGIVALTKGLARIPGVKSVSLTTNGLLFANNANELRRAGLASVNISLDTLKHEKFRAMTGVDGLDKVLSSINAAKTAGLNVKVNAVIIRDWNDDEVVDFARFAIDTGIPVRFIEFMPLDGSGIWAHKMVFSKQEMMARIDAALGKLVPLGNPDSEPARLYSVGSRGIMGFISSITEPFCDNCDRIRLTSDGKFLSCLFENPGHDLKRLVREGKSDREIADFIIASVRKKPEGIVRLISLDKLRPQMNLMHTIGG